MVVLLLLQLVGMLERLEVLAACLARVDLLVKLQEEGRVGKLDQNQSLVERIHDGELRRVGGAALRGMRVRVRGRVVGRGWGRGRGRGMGAVLLCES